MLLHPLSWLAFYLRSWSLFRFDVTRKILRKISFRCLFCLVISLILPPLLLPPFNIRVWSLVLVASEIILLHCSRVFEFSLHWLRYWNRILLFVQLRLESEYLLLRLFEGRFGISDCILWNLLSEVIWPCSLRLRGSASVLSHRIIILASQILSIFLFARRANHMKALILILPHQLNRITKGTIHLFYNFS